MGKLSAPLSQPEPPDRERYKPILIAILCAILLGAGSCWSVVNSSGDFQVIFAFIFILCAIALPVGLIFLLVAFVSNLTRRPRG